MNNVASIMNIGRDVWSPSAAWDRCLANRDFFGCFRLIQIAGWRLLTNYLNAGIGSLWYLYPFRIGCSKMLKNSASLLVDQWRLFCREFDVEQPYCCSITSNVTEVLCIHYQMVKNFLKDMQDGKIREINQRPNSILGHSKKVVMLIRFLDRLKPFLLSYWLHGSIGSNDVKPGWSDCDGLAIVSNKAFVNQNNLRKLRRGLIQARSFMMDIFPAQMHGHFIVAEPDINWFPTPMFPPVLFRNASCVLSTKDTLKIRETEDKRLAFEMLWLHGIADLLKPSHYILRDTLRKIAFLHRVYFLPCLVLQVYGVPCFKRDVFRHLTDIFTIEETNLLRQASLVWQQWKQPPFWIRALPKIAQIFRFNPMLNQQVSHNIMRYIPWFSRAGNVEWEALAVGMRTLALNVWQRTLQEIDIV